MKIERLIRIIIYMMNNDMVSATALASKFEVSKRTILRDMDTLTLAGIPIYAMTGVNGGYQIADSYKIDKQIIDSENANYIINALEGFTSALNDKKVDETLEKAKQLFFNESPTNGIYLDFSLMQEGKDIKELLQTLKHAISNKQTITFEYTNASNETRIRKLDPMVLIYRWYAWYVIGYNYEREAYRIFKLLRIRNLSVHAVSELKHLETPKQIVDHFDTYDLKSQTIIMIKGKQSKRVRIEEYLGSDIVEESNEYFILKNTFRKMDAMSLAILISFGDDIEILEPTWLKEQLLEKSKELVNLYSNSD